MIAAAAVFAALAMLAYMGRSIVTGAIPFTGDLLHFHYPLRQFYADALASTGSVAWMPSLYNGFYIAGEGQLGPFHPMHWLLYRWLPLETAFGIELVAAYPFAFAGAWLFLRRWCAGGPAAFGAMAFAFCGFMLEHGVHPNMVLVVAHVPWLLSAADATFHASAWPRRAAGTGAMALLVGSQLLLGHPQGAWLSLLIGVAYWAFLLARRTGPAPLASAAAVAGGVALGAAVGAIQLFATASATLASARAADPGFATTFALEPRYLLQLLEPYLFWGRVIRWNEVAPASDEFGAYGGAVTLVLTAWWLGSRWSADRWRGDADRLGLAALALGVLGLWLATGSYGWLYLLQTWLPLVGGFRVPARFILFTDLALAITATIAVHHLLRRPRDGAKAGLGAAWGIALASGITALLLAGGTGTPAAWPVVLGPVLFAGAAALVTLARYRARIAVTALVLLAGGDAALYGLAGVAAWQDFITRADAIQQTETPAPMRPGDGRLAHGGFPNLYTLAGYRVLDGYTALPPTRLLDYGTPNALRLAQIAYIHRRFRDLTGVPTGDALDDTWFAAPAPPLPRARLVTRAQVTRAPAVDLETIDVETTALTEHPVTLTGSAPGQVLIVDDGAGDIGLRVTVTGTQLLVVSESFHEGWQATIDGRDAAVERVNGDFLGCVVEEGNREVVFTFRPAHLVAGGYVSVSAAGGAMLLLLLGPLAGRARR